MKLAGTCIIGLAIGLGISQCNTPSHPKAISDMNTKDSVEVRDTAATVKLPVADTAAKVIPLTLVINKLTSDTAPVIIGVYGTANKFPDPKDQLKEYKFKAHGKTLVAKINDLKLGTYALAIYQDVNSNGKIDKNLIGIPTEVYAFSNNYKPTVKAPSFDNCRFDYTAKNDTVTMNMIK